eukprot:7072551-Pyramimonas_sp.AAC.1
MGWGTQCSWRAVARSRRRVRNTSRGRRLGEEGGRRKQREEPGGGREMDDAPKPRQETTWGLG